MKKQQVDKLVDLLEKKHITLRQLESMLTVKEAQLASAKIVQPRTREVFKIGVIADTHLCSKQCALEELKDFYKRCRGEGVKSIVHAGDILQGISCYPGAANDLVCYGVDEHVQYAVENYPMEKGITTYFILGN